MTYRFKYLKQSRRFLVTALLVGVLFSVVAMNDTKRTTAALLSCWWERGSITISDVQTDFDRTTKRLTISVKVTNTYPRTATLWTLHIKLRTNTGRVFDYFLWRNQSAFISSGKRNGRTLNFVTRLPPSTVIGLSTFTYAEYDASSWGDDCRAEVKFIK